MNVAVIVLWQHLKCLRKSNKIRKYVEILCWKLFFTKIFQLLAQTNHLEAKVVNVLRFREGIYLAQRPERQFISNSFSSKIGHPISLALTSWIMAY